MTETPDRPQPQPGLLKIAPYVPGKSQAAPGVTPIKLSANESPLGASPAAIAALFEADKSPEIYPEGTSRILREALGQVHGLDPERIVCGNGSDDLLHLLAQCYLGERDQAVMSRHGFNSYPIFTMGASAEIVMAPEKDYRADVDALLAAVTPATKMVFLANPNNPTGTYLGGEDLARLHAGLRPDILFVLDSAYAEYVTAEDYDVCISLVSANQNVVVLGRHVLGIGAVEHEQDVRTKPSMQALELLTAQICPGRIVGVGEEHHLRRRRPGLEECIDVGAIVFLRRHDDLGRRARRDDRIDVAAVPAHHCLIALTEVALCQQVQKIVRTVAADDPLRIEPMHLT